VQRIIRIIVYGKNNVKKDILTKKNLRNRLVTDRFRSKNPDIPPSLAASYAGSFLLIQGIFSSFGCPVQAGMVQTYPPMICVILAGTTVFSFTNQFAENPFFMRTKRKKAKNPVMTRRNNRNGGGTVYPGQKACVELYLALKT